MVEAGMDGARFFKFDTPDPKALALLSAESAEKLSVVPISLDEAGRLIVAMSDPNDLAALEEIRMLTGCSVVAHPAHAADIRRAISDFYKVAGSVWQAMQEHGSASNLPFSMEIEQLGAVSPDDAPVVKLLDHILELSISERASDIHIEPHENETKVRIRVDGKLFEALSFPVQIHNALLARVKVKARMDTAEKRRPQDGRIMVTEAGRKIDVRVSTIPSMYGEKAVLRLLVQENSTRSLEALGFSEKQRGQIEALFRSGRGICLVTGPTGSGKSTTLYALLERLKNTQCNVVSIEDPIEYSIDGITQIQVNEKIGLSFGALLRSVLRQDPDIIMVGEIRDAETAQLAVRAALTGHQVLATLHTNDAPSAVSRLFDMGIPNFLLAASLSGVIAQRLVRTLCPACKKEQNAEKEKTGGMYGCNLCRGSGYSGRTVVSEIMFVDDAMRELIGSSAPVHKIRAYALEKGMQGIFENAMEKALAGVTDMDEVYALKWERQA